MKIDIFNHILPQGYKETLYRVAPGNFYLRNVIETLPSLFDLNARFKWMDKYEDLRHVLTLSLPPIEQFWTGDRAGEIAKLLNDEMAELVAKHPDRFIAGVASLPMNNMDAALREAERAICELKLKGVQVFTPVNDQPLDRDEFMPLYEMMARYDLPIWIHPTRTADYPDYRSESRSKYMIFSNFGWPYETTLAMTRLVFSGVLERYPNLKFITHHCGGMVPYFEQRIIGAYDHAKILRGTVYGRELKKHPIEYFKMFYNDTATYGSTPGLMCGYSFCGVDRLLFGTDVPYDSEGGDRYTRQTIRAIEAMPISDMEKKKIFEVNARRILKI